VRSGRDVIATFEPAVSVEQASATFPLAELI